MSSDAENFSCEAGGCEAAKRFGCGWVISLLKACSPVLRAWVVAGRVHMAAPAQRAVSGARRERNSNKHKRLFLPNEPGGLIVSASPAACILPMQSPAQNILGHTHSCGAVSVLSSLASKGSIHRLGCLGHIFAVIDLYSQFDWYIMKGILDCKCIQIAGPHVPECPWPAGRRTGSLWPTSRPRVRSC